MAELEIEELGKNSDAVAILAAGMALAGTSAADHDDDFVVVPDGYKLEDLERFHDTPRRKRGTVKLHETGSFIEYVVIHKDVHSLVYCDRTKAAFTAVLDAHTAANPRWGEHHATLALQRTPEWLNWVQHNKYGFAQVAFAEFVEANLADIIDPKGADLLEMVVALEEKRSITFSSAVRLESGHRQFTYNEEGVAKGKAGQVIIPSQFTLEIAPFYGAPERPLPCLLRYRMEGGVVKFWYEMPRVQEVEREAIEGAAKQIGERLESKVLYGSPA